MEDCGRWRILLRTRLLLESFTGAGTLASVIPLSTWCCGFSNMRIKTRRKIRSAFSGLVCIEHSLYPRKPRLLPKHCMASCFPFSYTELRRSIFVPITMKNCSSDISFTKGRSTVDILHGILLASIHSTTNCPHDMPRTATL
jgi:hypothetical protein